jgi:hypothetical protein
MKEKRKGKKVEIDVNLNMWTLKSLTKKLQYNASKKGS